MRNETELIEMLQKRSNKLRFQALYIDDDVPLALPATQGHSVIEAKAKLMEWKKVTARDAPKLYRGTILQSELHLEARASPVQGHKFWPQRHFPQCRSHHQNHAKIGGATSATLGCQAMSTPATIAMNT